MSPEERAQNAAAQTKGAFATGGARVQRLPDALIDQIAAGEVVERPASVVKELVENAVDAGATRVRVELAAGGARLVAVSDNGSGMSARDAELAVQRHATSKLRSFDDLGGIASYGFRGEALPAIASVSRFRLRTRAKGAAEGFELQLENGKPVAAGPAGSPEGTRIEVADLFAALPARRKFLKSEGTEWGHVADWVGRAALALPHVHFDVVRGDKNAISWPAVSDPLDRIAAVLGEATAKTLTHAGLEHGDYKLSAFVSRPDAHRATGAGLYFFVNERPVRDKTMRHALLQVMRDVLPRGRFPTALLYLAAPEGAVDVNVHPAKWEVRFADSQLVHRLVSRVVRGAMEGRGWMQGEGERAGTGGGNLHGGAAGAFGNGEALVLDRGGDGGRPGSVRGEPGAGPGGAAGGDRSDWVFARGAGGEPGGARLEPGASAEAGEALPAEAKPFQFGELRLLGQLLGCYLLAEGPDGLVMIDQHAAHERVLYEQMRAHWLQGELPAQGLLTPATVELAPSALEALLPAPEVLKRLGFEVDPFDGNTVLLRSVPAMLSDRDPGGLIESLAEELRGGDGAEAALRAGSRVLPEADHIFATMACHAARRAGDILEPAEQRAVLQALDEIPWAPTCPHGRPVASPISLREIERRFGRG